MMIRKSRALAAIIPVLLALAVMSLSVPTRAQAVHHAHPKNWVQRHPTLTGIGAGVATHHALKVAAHNAKMHGKHLNWAERHPTLSAIGAGVATHHVIKATTH